MISCSANILLLLAITGCVAPYKYFPMEPSWDVYNTPPVISYNGSNDTYLVTSALVNNSVKYKIYIDTINEWRKNNGIP